MTTSEIIEQIHAELDTVNGRRSTRICGYGDVVQAIRETLSTPDWFGYALPTGLVTANCYDYRSVATRVAAIREIGTRMVRVNVYVGDGRAKAGRPSYADARRGEIVMSEDQASEIVRLQDAATNNARRIANMADDELRTIELTAGDSIAAGNCDHETARVASWFPGRSSVTVGEILDQLTIRHQQHLLSYVVRAARLAAQRELTAA